MTDPLVERLSRSGTPVISDALDRSDIAGQCHGLRAMTVERPIVGRAFTVRFAPVSPNSDATVGDYLDDARPGDVVVLDNGGRTDATVWGDLLSLSAAGIGIAGTVIDGVCRDVLPARRSGYPIYARGCYMRTGKGRVQVVDTQVPVTCSTAQVSPGDLVVADADGVVVIPASRAQQVIDDAEHIERREAGIRAAVQNGVPLSQARSDHGYFDLQRGKGS